MLEQHLDNGPLFPIFLSFKEFLHPFKIKFEAFSYQFLDKKKNNTNYVKKDV